MPARRRRKRRSAATSRRSAALRSLLLLCSVAAMAMLVGALAWLWPRCSGAGCPSVAVLETYTPPQASRVFGADGKIVAHLAPERRIVVPLERMPALLAGAFLAVEDKRFFSHEGVDYRRVVGAAVNDLRSMSFDEGFSTITMQLARNVFPEHLKREKTLRRKLWEVVLARQIEQAFSKDKILEMYLNQIYLGEGLYGVEAAAQGYFGKPAAQVNAAEAAMLAALPKAPSHYNPRQNAAAAIRRRNLVLGLMVEAGVIGEAAAETSRAEPLALVPPPEATGGAPFFIAAVRRELRDRFGADAATRGLRVFTALDTELQAAAETALAAQIRRIEQGELGRFRHATCTAVNAASSCLQGMFVALDPNTGDVLALVGGRDFALSQFDRAMQARRQAGSAFKPIVYASALEAGIPITTRLIGPGAVPTESGYYPADHVSDSVAIDLREGLRTSSNRAAVALGERAGAAQVVRTAHALGISTPIEEYPSTFLGAADIVPIELVSAYSAFVNGGAAVAPRLIQRVENAAGRTVWEMPVEREQVLSPGAAYLTLDLMSDVVDHGTGYGVRAAGLPYAIPAAGKTGTTNEAADVWFVGVTPDVVAGVWLGFDQPQRIMTGASGGKLAAPVWGRVISGYYRDRPAPAAWQPPAGLIVSEIDAETGMLATSACPGEQVRNESFLPGTEPSEYCPLHPRPGIEGWLRRTFRGIFGGSRQPPPSGHP